MKYKEDITLQNRIIIGPKFRFVLLTILLVIFYSTLLFSATIYIDPTNTSSGQNGSITNPYDSWTDFSFVNGNTYLQKRGTTYTSSSQIYISSKSNILIGAYNSGGRPKFSFTGSGYAFYIVSSSNCTVENFEVNGNSNAAALISIYGTTSSYTVNNIINNCLLYNAHSQGSGQGICGFYNDHLTILNTEIHNVAIDGIYLAYEPNIEIGYCNIYDVNRRYFSNPDQYYSSGDGIQLDGNYDGFRIHHTTIDRTNGAGNKYDLILNSAGSSQYASGIIEYCTFKTGPNVSSAVHIEMGDNIITRYNIFKGSTQGIKLGGNNTSNNLIHNNLFYDCKYGVGIAWGVTNTKVYNNVFYHVSSYHIWVDRTNVITRNNIHMRTTDAGVAIYNYGGGSWTISNNCYSSAAVSGTPGTGTNPIIGNPNFINPATGNFNIQSNSVVIDHGIPVGISFDMDNTAIFQGTAPEIGAFEYLTSSGSNLPPVINSQSFSINENTANGTTVGTVIASDPNSGQTLTYTITGGNTNNAFAINPSTGVLKVANSQSLNYESIPSFHLIVRVTDNGTGNLWAQSTISVNLININENPLISNQAFSVVQNSTNGTIVGTVAASDPDQSQILSYSITAGNANNTLTINTSTGVITVANSATLIQGSVILTVRATDNGSPILWSAAAITITVTSPPNQAPVIAAQSFSIVQNLPNGTLVGTIVASDPNAGQTLTYSITTGNTNTTFAINTTNGNLTIANSPALNPGIFLLTVRVTDNGNPGLFSQAIITVNVTTPANQAPVIAAQSFSIVQYSPNGSLVGTIVASDPNAGQTLIYSITAGNNNTIFAVNATNGNLTIANSPALSPGIFLLTVRVTDNGNPGLFSQAIITVNVTTPTNQAPVIAAQIFSIQQYSPNGSLVGTIVASDPNAGQTLIYSITAGNYNTIFAVNATNGNLTIANSPALNPGIFLLTVRVTDNGNPGLFSQAIITVNVTTPANQAPAIVNQTFNAVQYAVNGTLVGTIIASDPNPGQTLTYSIITGNTNSAFTINSSNGNLTVSNSAALSLQVFSLIIRVTDNGSPSLWSQATVTVNITQQSNQAPVIANQFFSVAQYAPTGTLVGTVVASDPNTGQTLTFSFIAGNTNGAFGINSSTGNLYVAKSSALIPANFSLTVRVCDNGTPSMWSQAIINITVNQPVNAPLAFSQKFFMFLNHPEGEIIGKVKASSQIEGHLLNYNLQGNSISSGFRINSKTGEITPNNIQNLHVGTNLLIVRIADAGNPSLSTEAEITIIITENPAGEFANLNTDALTPISNFEVLVYPNPSNNGIFNLNLKGLLSAHTEIQVFDLSGKLITSISIDSTNDLTIDLSSQPKGSYILKILNGGLYKTTKAIVS